LTDVFTGLCDRLADAGFVAFAPDLYGGATTTEPAVAEGLLKSRPPGEGIEIVTAALDLLLAVPACRGSGEGVIGFSMGGGYATWLATIRPEVRAVVLFYGGVDQEDSFPHETQAAFLGHFAENDEFESIEQVHSLQGNLRAAGREVEFRTYAGAGHWFFEENRPDVYDPQAAELAWRRTELFLHRHLD